MQAREKARMAAHRGAKAPQAIDAGCKVTLGASGVLTRAIGALCVEDRKTMKVWYCPPPRGTIVQYGTYYCNIYMYIQVVYIYTRI